VTPTCRAGRQTWVTRIKATRAGRRSIPAFVLIHLAARTLRGRPLADGSLGEHLWRRLRENFPDALAACLMPDHVHLVTASRDLARERRRMAHVLSGLTRFHASKFRWEVGAPSVIPNVAHLRRNLRYVHLNPCRDGLSDDPLVHPFTTHRGVVGAELDPWVSAERLARALGESPIGFAQRFHEYVSGDPSALPEGTPFPRPAAARVVPAIPLERICIAAKSATPWSPPSVRARTTALLARHQGWRDAEVIAAAARISPRTAQRHSRLASLEPIAAAALCLGDERLLRAHTRRRAA
jgi:hypothetical protein